MSDAKGKDIVLVVDYHDANLQVRWFDELTREQRLMPLPTDRAEIDQLASKAAAIAEPRGGQVVWIMESTTGWVRVKKLLLGRVRFVLANVLAIPLPPKARRRKTDKLDTARLLREYRNDSLEESDQPDDGRRSLRRVVKMREDLVRRRTQLRNWIDRYLAHETWHARMNLGTKRGRRAMRKLIQTIGGDDGFVLGMKLDELEQVELRIEQVEQRIETIAADCVEAQRLDEIKGIGPVGAVSIVARIGDAKRFADAEALVAYAGLAPSVHQSDQTCRTGKLGGGGTDRSLRHYLIEASAWAGKIPRYQAMYQRVRARRGRKVGRLAVARALLRSIYKMLTTDQAFVAEAAGGTPGAPGAPG